MILWFFEIGYVLQHLAIIFQILQIRKNKNTEGIAIETILFFTIATLCRFVWIFDSKLKNFYFTYFEILMAVSSLAYIIYLYNNFKHNDYIRQQVQLPVYFKFFTLLLVITVLSFFFHPGKKNEYYLSNQMFVSANIYSECVGLIPQLYLISKSSETGNVSRFYLIFLGFARFFRIFFWIKMYLEGNSFLSLIFADVIHSILLILFIYVFKKNLGNELLPQFSVDGESKRKKIF